VEEVFCTVRTQTNVREKDDCSNQTTHFRTGVNSTASTCSESTRKTVSVSSIFLVGATIFKELTYNVKTAHDTTVKETFCLTCLYYSGYEKLLNVFRKSLFRLPPPPRQTRLPQKCGPLIAPIFPLLGKRALDGRTLISWGSKRKYSSQFLDGAQESQKMGRRPPPPPKSLGGRDEMKESERKGDSHAGSSEMAANQAPGDPPNWD
jgi:hypothetical protein